MDFDACYKVLAARPAHTHEHAHVPCEGEQHTHEHALTESDVNRVADAVEASLKLDGGDVQQPEGETASVHGNAASSDNSAPPPLPAPSVASTLSVPALGREFFKLQEQRVQVYREFQAGFETFKATAQFPSFCADITQRFAAISAEVNTIEAALRDRPRARLAQCVRRVQLQEKEKLLLTSALLVEKLRVSDALHQADDGSATVLPLLEKSVVAMTAQHTAIIEQINELLDELRIELADEADDEDDAGVE